MTGSFLGKVKARDKHGVFVKIVKAVAVVQFLSDVFHILISKLIDLLGG
jgi:hypothetical protein